MTRPRALIVAYCFPPNAAIGTHRTLRLVSHLAANGWDVDVLTAEPGAYLPGTVTDQTLLDRVPSNVRVVRSGAFRGFTKLNGALEPLKRRLRGVARAAHPVASHSPTAASRVTSPGVKATIEELCALPDKDVGWALPALSRGLSAFSKTPPDVIFSSAPPWTCHLVAGRLASSFGCRWVADFRDPWVRSEWRRYKSRPAMAIAQRLERRAVERADAVTFTTQTARNEFAAYYGADIASRLHVVFNGCEPTELSTLQTSDDRFVLLHAGSLYGGRSPMPLLEALAAARRTNPQAKRIVLRFLGSSSFPGVDLRRVCHDLGVTEAVEFLARVSRDESLRQMQQADALLILQGGTTMAIPGKLYEYLAAQRPILAVCEPGEMAAFITSNRLGIAPTAGDPAALARALNDLTSFAQSGWVPADPALYDGRLRAAELAGLIESVLPAGRGAAAFALGAAQGGQRG